MHKSPTNSKSVLIHSWQGDKNDRATAQINNINDKIEGIEETLGTIDHLTQEIAGIGVSITELGTKIKGNAEKIDTKVAGIKKFNVEVETTLTGLETKINNNTQKIETEIAALTEDHIPHFKQDIETHLEELRTKISKNKDLIDEEGEELRDLKDDFEEHSTTLLKTHQTLESLQNFNSGVEERLQDLNVALKKLKENLLAEKAANQVKFTVLETFKTTTIEKFEAIANEVESLKGTLSHLDLPTLKLHVEELKSKVSQLQTETQERQEKGYPATESLLSEIEVLSNKVETLVTEKESMKSLLDSVKASGERRAQEIQALATKHVVSLTVSQKSLVQIENDVRDMKNKLEQFQDFLTQLEGLKTQVEATNTRFVEINERVAQEEDERESEFNAFVKLFNDTLALLLSRQKTVKEKVQALEQESESYLNTAEEFQNSIPDTITRLVQSAISELKTEIDEIKQSLVKTNEKAHAPDLTTARLAEIDALKERVDRIKVAVDGVIEVTKKETNSVPDTIMELVQSSVNSLREEIVRSETSSPEQSGSIEEIKEIVDTNSELLTEMRADVDSLLSIPPDFGPILDTVGALEGKVDSHQNSVDSKIGDIEASLAEILQLNAADKDDQDLDAVKALNASLQAKVSELEGNVRENFTALAEQIDVYTNKIEILDEEIQSCCNEVSEMKAENSSKFHTIDVKVGELEDNKDSMEDLIESNKIKLDALEEESDQLKKGVKELTESLKLNQVRETEVNELQSKTQTISGKIHDVESTIAELRETLETRTAAQTETLRDEALKDSIANSLQELRSEIDSNKTACTTTLEDLRQEVAVNHSAHENVHTEIREKMLISQRTQKSQIDEIFREHNKFKREVERAESEITKNITALRQDNETKHIDIQDIQEKLLAHRNTHQRNMDTLSEKVGKLQVDTETHIENTQRNLQTLHDELREKTAQSHANKGDIEKINGKIMDLNWKNTVVNTKMGELRNQLGQDFTNIGRDMTKITTDIQSIHDRLSASGDVPVLGTHTLIQIYGNPSSRSIRTYPVELMSGRPYLKLPEGCVIKYVRLHSEGQFNVHTGPKFEPGDNPKGTAHTTISMDERVSLNVRMKPAHVLYFIPPDDEGHLFHAEVLVEL